jgi:hypothetical protein
LNRHSTKELITNIKVCLAQWESDGLKYRRSCVQSTERTTFCTLPGKRGTLQTSQRGICDFRMPTQFFYVFLVCPGPPRGSQTRSSICLRRWRHRSCSCTRLIRIRTVLTSERASIACMAQRDLIAGVRRLEPATSDL